MNSPSTLALVVVGAAAAALVGTLTIMSLPLSASLVSAFLITASAALVAFAAQSRRLRDEERLVYRPVYVRRHVVQRRVRSGDE